MIGLLKRAVRQCARMRANGHSRRGMVARAMFPAIEAIEKRYLLSVAPIGPIIFIDGFDGPQYDNQAQVVAWQIFDPDGIASTSVTLNRLQGGTRSSIQPEGFIDFNDLGPGNYTLTVSTSSNAGKFNSISRSLTVLDDDTQGPDIRVSGFDSGQYDTGTQEISWDITDPSGVALVTVRLDRQVGGVTQTILNDTNAEASDSFNFNRWGAGRYSLYITAWDGDNDRVNDASWSSFSRTIDVMDDDTQGPIIVVQGAEPRQTDGQKQEISWNITDESGVAHVSVRVLKGSATIFESDEASGTYNFDHQGLGTYTVQITATDGDDDSDYDGATSYYNRVIVVEDDDVLPPDIWVGGIASPQSVSDQQEFSWRITDPSGLESVSVRVDHRVNNVWVAIHQSSEDVGSFNFDSFGPGTFAITITARDADNDRAGDSAITTFWREVVVESAGIGGPTITLGGAIGTVFDNQDRVFTWEIEDPDGLRPITITIQRIAPEGTSTIYSSTAAPASGSHNFNSRGLGIFLLSVIATDDPGNRTVATREVLVLDDDTAGPTIVLTGSQGVEYDNQPQSFAWSATDPSGISSTSVTVTRQFNGNTSSIFTSTAASGTYNFDSRGPGYYVIVVEATDNDWDNGRNADRAKSIAMREVLVIDDDTTPPTVWIEEVDPVQLDSDDQVISWIITDSSGVDTGPGRTFIKLERLNSSFSWSQILSSSQAAGSFNFNDRGAGTYLLTVTAFDNDNDYAGDGASITVTRTIIVLDDDTDPPVVQITGSSGLEHDGQEQYFSWDITDASGLSFVSVTIVRNNGGMNSTVHTSSSPAGTFNFDHLGLGTYLITIIATDNDDDVQFDKSTITVTRSVTVIDDDTDIATIILGGSSGIESHGLVNEFTWEILGGAGEVIIRHDGQVIHTASGSKAGTFNFDHLGLGAFDITVIASDDDNDWPGDTLPGTVEASRQVTVINIAPVLVSVLAGQDQAGAMLVLFSAYATDADGDELEYAWDFGDGTTAQGASIGHTYADGGTYLVTVTVFDGHGGEVVQQITIEVIGDVNVPGPVASLAAPDAGVPYQPLNFAATIEDQGEFTLAWNFGDGRTLVLPSADPLALGPVHEYTAPGQYTVGLTISQAGGGSTVLTALVQIHTFIRSDGTIYIGGTPGADTITIAPDGVDMDGLWLGPITGAGRIVVYAGDGDDIVTIASSIHIDAELYGGAGNDTLKGGAGNDIIVGGDGDDLISGSHGRDLIIGGMGADRLIGNADDDILIAGVTLFDGNPAALRAILAEWTSGRDYITRVENIRGNGTGPRNNGEYFLRTGGEGVSVFDDGAADLLTGNAGSDWFIFNVCGEVPDRVTDLKKGELTDHEIDLLTEGTGILD
jgi:hypothetical protein